MKKLATVWATGLLMLAMTGVASASVVVYTDRSSFNAQGSIDSNTNFLDYGTGYTPISTPLIRGDVTFNQAEGIIGTTSGYTKTEQILAGPIVSADIATAPKYNMYGADLAQYNSTPITITIYTDKNIYLFSHIWVSNMNTGNLTFLGGVLTGEYIKGIQVKADNPYSGVGGTNLTFGHSPAPEPSTYALMGIGGLLIAFRLRKSVAGSAITA